MVTWHCLPVSATIHFTITTSLHSRAYFPFVPYSQDLVLIVAIAVHGKSYLDEALGWSHALPAAHSIVCSSKDSRGLYEVRVTSGENAVSDTGRLVVWEVVHDGAHHFSFVDHDIAVPFPSPSPPAASQVWRFCRAAKSASVAAFQQVS